MVSEGRPAMPPAPIPQNRITQVNHKWPNSTPRIRRSTQEAVSLLFCIRQSPEQGCALLAHQEERILRTEESASCQDRSHQRRSSSCSAGGNGRVAGLGTQFHKAHVQIAVIN